jgi:hypothetical protein
MTIGTKLFNATLLLGSIAAFAFAAVTHADTRVCPPPPGSSAPWDGNNLVQGLNASQDCWLGTSYETATENVGVGKIMVGAGGGAVAREVWAYSYNNGVHTDVRVKGYDAFDNPTCTCIDTLEDGQWRACTVSSHGTPTSCNNTLYAYIEGWKP